MTPLQTVHQHYVAGRRAKMLSRALVDVIPADASVLDVGCGDGCVSHLVNQQRPDLVLRGIDVIVRQQTAIPVDPYDGEHIPFDDRQFDVVMLIDVLHHTNDPLAVLREAARVAARAVVIKDHLCDGWLASPTLRFMDRVSNRRYGVSLPYNYFRLQQWHEAFDLLGLRVDDWRTRLDLYPWPAKLVFERSLHFMARLVRSED
jgi:SAM-dependent methyltransferase